MSFLVKQMPPLDGLKSDEIEQFYLSESLTPLRLRRYGEERYELTKKIPLSRNDLSRQEEKTIPLDAEEFAELKKLARRGLSKTRYYMPLEYELKAEIDVYHGPLEGLITVEVEFPNEHSRDRFLPLEWFGQDITQEEWSTNSYLAGRSFEEIKQLFK